MSEKEYEMDEHHKSAAAFLVEQIAQRDEIAAQLKLLPPEARPEGLRLLAEFDKAIERSEQALANDYEAYQKYQRSLEAQAKAGEDALESMAGVFVHVKYRLPDKLDELKATIFDNWSDADKQDFYDRAARLEAGDLIRIIAVQGETREQTEEFLKNFRAAEQDK